MTTRQNRRLLVLALLLTTVFGCRGREATDGGSRDGPQLIEVELSEVRRSQIHSSADLVGTLIPVRTTTIVSEVDGIIESFPTSDRKVELEAGGPKKLVALGLDIGHEVKRGEPLVQIDPAEFKLSLEVAKADLALVMAELKNLLAWKRDEEVAQIRAQLKEAEALVARTQADLKRSEQLLERNATSDSDHEAVVAAAAAAEAAKEQAEAALAMALSGPTAEQIEVAKAKLRTVEAEVAVRQEKLDKTTIRCPYDAVVTERYVEVGDRVTAMPRVEIMEIMDPDILFAEISVPEKYQGKVKLGQEVEVRATGIDRPLPGVVDLVNAKIDPRTRNFRVRVTIDNRKRLFRPGGFVDVKLPVESASGALVVPRQAICLSEGRHAVFVYQQGRVRKRDVTVGISSEDECVIVRGLSGGEQVVVGNASLLADGMQVRLKGSGSVAAAAGGRGSYPGDLEEVGPLAAARPEVQP